MHDRIKILMKLLNISNIDLAQLLQVDISLVSKWRNGARSMKANPEYINRFVAYVVNLDKKNNYASVKELLQEDYQITSASSEQEIILLLRDWLCAENNMTERNSILQEMLKNRLMKGIAQSTCWEGNEGKREAVKYFTEYAIACSPHAEMISFTTEANNWFHEDWEFFLLWNKKIKEFFDKGNVIKIIHPLNRNSRELSNSMMKWLPLHIASDVKGYYLKQYDDESFVNLTALILTGEMALYGISTDQNIEPGCTWTTNMPKLVGVFENVAKRALEKAIPLFKRYSAEPDESVDCIVKSIISMYQENSSCFYYNDFNCFIPDTAEKRRELLSNTNLEQEKADRIVEILGSFDIPKKKSQHYYMFNTERLKKYLDKETVRLDILSVFINEPVYMSKEVFGKSVRDFFKNAMCDDNVNIGFVDGDISNELGDLSLWSGGNNVKSFCTIFNDHDRIKLLEIEEYSAAISIFRKMEMTWRLTPHLLKSKEYVIHNILKELYGTDNKSGYDK